MAMSDAVLAFANDLKRAPGDTVDKRVEYVLANRGWDKEIGRIQDHEFRNVIMIALERMALRHEPPQDARSIEKDRQRKERERAAVEGRYGGLFPDLYAGMEPAELVRKLPCEKYWVPSLQEFVAREDLELRLDLVAELRRQSNIELLRIEQTANVYRHELAIFDELLRQGATESYTPAFDAVNV